MKPPAGVRLALPDDAAEIAALHCAAIAEGFLVVLGPRFLEALYARVAASEPTFALVHVDGDGRIDGFVAVAADTRLLYREFLLRDGLRAAARALPSIARHPAKTFETFRYGLGRGTDVPGAEILATAVSSRRRGSGIGRTLVDAAILELRNRGVRTAHVVAAANNLAALRTYTRCGFRKEATVEVHRGVVQEVLVWP